MNPWLLNEYFYIELRFKPSGPFFCLVVLIDKVS